MIVSSLRPAVFSFLMLLGAPLASQTLEQLDELSDETADEQAGIALALKQTERGELLEALATLERVLTQFPRSAQARLHHAMLLCKVGDLQGALIELNRLKEKDYPPEALRQAITNCSVEIKEHR